MRLIDADELRKNMTFSRGIREDGFLYVPYGEVMEKIKTQPTAYDTDKVVRELEKRSKKYNSGVRLHGKPEDMLTDDAIEIVKQGGVDEAEQKLKEKN